jgi:hypothetical protein
MRDREHPVACMPASPTMPIHADTEGVRSAKRP